MSTVHAQHALLHDSLVPVHRGGAQTHHVADENRLMHRGVYKVALLCWAGFVSMFWITFWVSTNALFMVVVGTFYAMMFFGVPIVMSRMAPTRRRAQSFRDFLHHDFVTLNGRVSGRDAMLQVILVPLLLGLGGIAVGVIIHLARASAL